MSPSRARAHWPTPAPCQSRGLRPAGRGAAAEIAAIVAEEGFASLKAPVARVTAPDVHPPFSMALEKLMYPTLERIGAAVLTVSGTAAPEKEFAAQ